MIFEIQSPRLNQLSKMEALVCRKLGDATIPPDCSDSSALSYSAAHPIPPVESPTGVRVRVRATSVQFADYLQIQGKYQERPALPFIPGFDYSGTVDAVGPLVTLFRPGDAVCAFTGEGSYANFIVADQAQLLAVPDGCELVEACAIPVSYATSHVALMRRAQLQKNQVLLVLGAAGGVGVSAVQIGKVSGAIVIAAARGEEKVKYLESLGVDHAVNLSKETLTDSVKGFLKARKLKGVDVLYDPVGGKLTKESLRLLNWGAQILIIGFASGEVPVIPANIALVKNWTIHGFNWSSRSLTWSSSTMDQLSTFHDSTRELLSWLAKGLITVHISHVFSLPEAHLAFSVVTNRKAIGKVMITFDDLKATRPKL